MSMSQEIFALRKAQQLDEAYLLVNELIAQDTDDAWEIKACAWCLIDLIKREAQMPHITQSKEACAHFSNSPRCAKAMYCITFSSCGQAFVQALQPMHL